MALPNGPLYRVSIGGKLASDTWSVNVWGDGAGTTGTPSQQDLVNFATEVYTNFNALVWSLASNSLKSFNAASVDLSFVNCEFYSGGSIQQSAREGFTAVVGTGSSPHAGYTAMVATLLTAFAGRSKRGRIYLPATAIPMTAGTLQTSATISGVCGGLATMLGGLNTTPGNLPGNPTVPVVVLSRTLGIITPVSAVRIDSKLDTQRGRQSKFIPTTTSIVHV